MTDVVVIDSGGANLASLGYALARLGVDSTVSTDPARIRRASHVLLPGVGSAHDAMARLDASGLTKVIPLLTQPLLGICLGMQLLFQASAESAADRDTTPGLGVIDGKVERLTGAPDRPVPHMGWNQLDPCARIPCSQASHRLRVFRAQLRSTGHRCNACCHRLWPAVCTSRAAWKLSRRAISPERSATVGARLLANFLGHPGGSPMLLIPSIDCARAMRTPAQGRVRRDALRCRSCGSGQPLCGGRRTLGAHGGPGRRATASPAPAAGPRPCE
jgi:glutamine amidotransferase